jgi:predicted pyridoxine 5'-phosphate oxidase superfamily flavin-nucleotide-binding protein
MLKDEIEKASALAKAVGYVLVATSGENGVPHLCAAGQLEVAGDDCVAVTEWFCPGTIANTDKNRNISVVSWDADSDEGYQLIGTVRQSLDVGVLDGVSPRDEIAGNMPQVEKRLVIDVEKVVSFKMQPHTDKELNNSN